MSFTWFRKYEKIFLWITVAFTVLIFALFSAMSDLESVLGGDGGGGRDQLAGRFTVATTGETREVDAVEFRRFSDNFVSFTRLMYQGQVELEAEDVWRLFIHVEDAKGAGLYITDSEIARGLGAEGGINMANYRQNVMARGFPSVRSFEQFYRNFLLAQRWEQALFVAAGAISADEVYQRWRVDHELFDLDAVVFADADPESIADPGSDVLNTYFDELPEFRRTGLFFEAARHDVAFAYSPYDVDAAALIEGLDAALVEGLSGLDEATEIQLLQRFTRVKAQRYPDLDELGDNAEIRAALTNELKVMALAQAAHVAFAAAETQDLATFEATMASHGLHTVNPDGLLGPDELSALEPIGDDILPLRLRGMEAGRAQFLQAFSGEETAAAVIFVEDLVEQRALSFAEAGDKVLVEWRKTRLDQAAKAFIDDLKAAARALPAVQEIIVPLELAAAEAAVTAIAAAEAAFDAGPGADPVDDERREGIRAAELALVELDIDRAISDALHEVWDAQLALLGEGPEVLDLVDVPRNFRSTLDVETRDPADVEQFIKSHFSIFQLAENSVTNVLRLPVAEVSSVVKVRKRHFPAMDEMFSDEQGMTTARVTQSREAATLNLQDLTPEKVMEAHGLLVAQPPEAAAKEAGADGESPDGGS